MAAQENAEGVDEHAARGEGETAKPKPAGFKSYLVSYTSM
jgi:hypothetical protein